MRADAVKIYAALFIPLFVALGLFLGGRAAWEHHQEQQQRQELTEQAFCFMTKGNVPECYQN